MSMSYRMLARRAFEGSAWGRLACGAADAAQQGLQVRPASTSVHPGCEDT